MTYHRILPLVIAFLTLPMSVSAESVGLRQLSDSVPTVTRTVTTTVTRTVSNNTDGSIQDTETVTTPTTETFNDGSEPVIRPVFAAYTAEFGSGHLTDTYLSPIKYTGWHAALDYQRYQAMRFAPDDWTMRLHFNLGVDKTDNPARNATMWDIMLSADWGMMRRFRPFIPELTLAIGGSTGIDVGCLYNARNSNNPASAKAAWTVNLTGFASWRTKLWSLPVSLTYQPTLPVAGVFFSPDYGELYYEIYLGDHKGLAHGAWWGNYFKLDNQLTADLHFGATNLRLGYHGSIFSSKVNHVVTHIFSHAFSIGVSGEWLSVNPRKPVSPNARMIHALY